MVGYFFDDEGEQNEVAEGRKYEKGECGKNEKPKEGQD